MSDPQEPPKRLRRPQFRDRTAQDFTDRGHWFRHLYDVGDRDGDQPDYPEAFDRSRNRSGFGMPPAEAAFELLSKSLLALQYAKSDRKLSAEWIYELQRHLEAASRIHYTLNEISAPERINEDSLERRRQAGEVNPKPRVRVFANRTTAGNLSIHFEPHFNNDGHDIAKFYSTMANNHIMNEVVKFQGYDKLAHFSDEVIEDDPTGRSAVCVFVLRCFQYLIYEVREFFDVSFGNILCLDLAVNRAPRLRILDPAELAHERQLEAEALETDRQEARIRKDVEWAESLKTPVDTILAAVDAAQDRKATKNAISSTLVRYGVKANSGSVNSQIQRLRSAAEYRKHHPADTKPEEPVAPVADDQPLRAPVRRTTVRRRSAAPRVRSPKPESQESPATIETKVDDPIRFQERFNLINEFRMARGWPPHSPVPEEKRTLYTLRSIAKKSGTKLPP